MNSMLRKLKSQLVLTSNHLAAVCRQALETDEVRTHGLETTTLEQRVMLSASPLAIPIDADVEAASSSSVDAAAQDETQNQATQEQALDDSADSAVQSARVLIFVDESVPDYRQFLDVDNLADEGQLIEVVVLDRDQDGIDVITQHLSNRTDVDSIHVVSHGTGGNVWLGNTVLNNQTMPGYAGDLASWSSSLSTDADILIYGCNVAESVDGQLLIESLSALTGADIAASDDVTGSEKGGGDWDFEYLVGNVQTNVAYNSSFLSTWSGTLATVTANDDTYTLTEDETLNADSVLNNDVIVGMSTNDGNLTLEWDPAQDLNGNAVWEDNTGVTGFDFTMSTGGTYISNPNASPGGITAAWSFDGTGGATAVEGFETLSGDPTDDDATFEFWFRPTDNVLTREVLFDSGWTLGGLSIILNGTDHGGDVMAEIMMGNTLGENVLALADITSHVNSGEYIHLVSSIDISNGRIQVFVNGVEVALEENDNVSDWTGEQFSGDQIAIATNSGSLVTNHFSIDDFDGEIGLFRFYETKFNESDSQTNYEALTDLALAPAPQTVTSANGVSVTIAADGSFTYSASGLHESLNSGQSAVDTFTYTIDTVYSSSAPDLATVTLNITGVNDAPSLDENNAMSVISGGNVAIPLSHLSSSDVDNSDSEIIYVLTYIPDNGTIEFVDGGTTTLGIGDTFTQADLASGKIFYRHDGSATSSDRFNVTVRDTGGAVGAIDNAVLISISSSVDIQGTVYEDVNGDSNLSDAVGVDGVGVYLYQDNGDGLLGAGDSYVSYTTTTSGGQYRFTVAPSVLYFVAVNSADIDPTAGYNSGYTRADVWAQQTYGTDNAFVANGSGGTEFRTGSGAYGGRQAGISDNAVAGLLFSQHVTQVAMGGTDVTNIDFGFSFNVVTNTLGGNTLTPVQGSLRQFIANANAIQGGNEMRFVPVESANSSDSGNSWWTVDINSSAFLLPSLVDDNTIINGKALHYFDGISDRNTNNQTIGTSTGVGLGADVQAGTADDLTIDGVEAPELQIETTIGNNTTYGLQILGDDVEVRNIAVRNFGGAGGTGGNIHVAGADHTTLEDVVIGLNATVTDTTTAGLGSNAHGIRIENSTNGIVRDSVIVGSDMAGVSLESSSGWIIAGNEIARNGRTQTEFDGVRLANSSTSNQVVRNYIHRNNNHGIDVLITSDNTLIRNNTITANGDSGSGLEAAGIRLQSDGNTITLNYITNNSEDGILVRGGTAGSAATQNEITKNSFQGNGGQAIDLSSQSASLTSGDGIDGVNNYSPNRGNLGMDAIEFTSVVFTDGSLNFQFNTTGTLRIELYVAAAADASDFDGTNYHGEGLRYFGTLVHNGTTYVVQEAVGPAPVAGDSITALAIDTDGNTSEFSANSVSYQNDTPSIALTNPTTNLAETADTSTSIKVADILISDDAHGTNNLALSGTNASAFVIVGSELHLAAGTTLVPGTLTVTVNVDDPAIGTNPDDSIVFNLTIDNINTPPTISLSNITTNLPENTDTSSSIKLADIDVSDDGTGTNNLSLSGTHASSFQIIGSELHLRAGATLDYETLSQLDVVVEVDDTSIGGTFEDSVAYSLTVNDVNEAPTVSLANVVSSLPEDTDTSSAIKIADIVVADDALGTNSLALSGTHASSFTIVGNELFLQAGVSLDHETLSSLSVTVEVDDTSLGATFEDQASTALGITDVNEAPTVSLSNIATNLPENTDTSSSIKLADIDVSDDGTGTNNLSLSGTHASSFQIVGNELHLRAGISLDHETLSQLDVVVEVDDTSIGGTFEDSVAYSLTVNDVNEAPTVSLANVVSSLPENTDTSSAIKIADIVVADDALGTNSLALSGTHASSFTIVGNELFLQAGVSLDHETLSSLSVTVEVDDTSIGATFEDQASTALGVTDVNEAPTVSLSNITTNLPENTDTSSAIKIADIVVADDALGTNSLALSGTHASSFSIVGNELFLQAGVSLDHETLSSLSVTVEVDDTSLGATFEDQVSTALGITDVNEAPTVALINVLTSLVENTDTTSAIKVADIVVTDDALGTNSLSLGGTDASSFTIVGNELFLRAGVILDHETQPNLNVTVQVDDAAISGSPDDQAVHMMTITDGNEAPTVSLINQTTSLPENTDTSSPIKIADIVITDDNLGTNTLNLAGTHASQFTIVGNELFLRSGVTLDHESFSTLDVTVQVDDASLGAVHEDEQALSLAVSDVNEAPIVSLANVVLSLAENSDTSAPIKIADILVSDDALGTNTLSLTGPQASSFTIVGNELYLQSGVALDHESLASLAVTVNVDDSAVGTSPDSQVSHVLSITDVNEAPSVSLANAAVSLAENANTTGGIKVADIMVTDDALGSNSLSLSGTDASSFTIVGNDLYLRSGVALDHETLSSLRVFVNVDDSSLPGTPEDFASYTLGIANVNEAPATTGLAPSLLTIIEDGQRAFDTSTWFQDQDVGDLLRFEIVEVANAWLTATVNSSTNTLTLSADADVHGQTQIRVRAIDQGGLSSEFIATVDVTPTNDTLQPVNQSLRAINGNAVQGALLPAAVDADGEVLQVIITTPPENGSLRVNADGTFAFVPNPDFSGTVFFEYVIDDGVARSNPAVVSIVANPTIAAAPVVNAETVTENNNSADELVITENGTVGLPPDVNSDEDSNSELTSQVAPSPTSEGGPGAENAGSSQTKLLADSLANSSEYFIPRFAVAGQASKLEASTFDEQLSIAQSLSIDTSEEFAILSRPGRLWEELDAFKEANASETFASFAIGTVGTATSGLIMGYVIWAIRSGLFISSVMATMPAWNFLDPFVVLDNGNPDEEGGESLEDIVESERVKLDQQSDAKSTEQGNVS